VTRRHVLAARVLAVLADGLQLGLLPLFVGGGLSLANDVLDVLVAGAMIALVGWHWAFVPTFLAELVPGLDLVPTWTMAALLVTRSGGSGPPAGTVQAGAAGPASASSNRVIDVTPAPPARPPGEPGKAP
jgi:hypothetical protein